MIRLKLDSYGTYARAFPIYITIIPVVLVLFPILPEGFDWKLGGASTIVLLPLSYLCRQIGGDLGKRREKALWRKWDGPSTTRFLRHDNREFNSNTRERIYATFRSFGFYVPSQEEQDQSPQKADNLCKSCIDELRRRTRDSKRFPRVFQELRDYGFRRNIFALKPIGLPLTILSFFICLIMAFHDWKTGEQLGSAIVPCFINLGLVLVWLLCFTEKAVKLTDDRYARFLLEACLDLEIEDGDNPVPKR